MKGSLNKVKVTQLQLTLLDAIATAERNGQTTFTNKQIQAALVTLLKDFILRSHVGRTT